MPDELAAIHDRLERADEQLKEIKEMLRAYFQGGEHRFAGKFDLEAKRVETHNGAPLPPVRLSTIVGQVLHNLRSALDHLAWSLVQAHRGKPTEDTKFPILKASPTPNKKGIRKPLHVHGGISDDAATIIENAQPYQWAMTTPPIRSGSWSG